jgi:hypothetical protein
LLWLETLTCPHPGLPFSMVSACSGVNLTFHQRVLVCGRRPRQHPKLGPDLVQLFLFYLPTPDHTWISQTQISYSGKSHFFFQAKLLGVLEPHGPVRSLMLVSMEVKEPSRSPRVESLMVTTQASLLFFFPPIFLPGCQF